MKQKNVYVNQIPLYRSTAHLNPYITRKSFWKNCFMVVVLMKFSTWLKSNFITLFSHTHCSIIIKYFPKLFLTFILWNFLEILERMLKYLEKKSFRPFYWFLSPMISGIISRVSSKSTGSIKILLLYPHFFGPCLSQLKTSTL